MNALPGNPYANMADGKSNAHAAILANLAVAHEQRTANIIAYTALVVQVQLSGLGLSDDLRERAEMLEERLGLRDTK